MIGFGVDGWGNVVVQQRDVPPTVYLDHWAIRKFSQDARLGGQFLSAVEQTRGTVVLSWLNVAEFCKVEDEAQGGQAYEFFKAIFPQIFFLNSDPYAVIREENKLLAGSIIRIAPHSDAALLGTLRFTSGVLTLRDLFTAVRGDQLTPTFEKMADTAIAGIEKLREAYEEKPEFRRDVARLPTGQPIQRGTRYILRELVRTLLINRTLKVTRNHAIDLMHAVVALSYCEFVLLDKHWETQARQARERIEKSGLQFPFGRVYSERSNGLERFFQDFATSAADQAPPHSS